MSKRVLVPLGLFLLAALSLSACGGGDSDEDQIVEVIEKSATTNDPENCTKLQTLRFNQQNTQRQGKDATKACEEEAEEEEDEAEAAKVSDVSVDDGKATAEVEFEGSSLASQILEVALVRDDGDWKLDQIEGFAHYDGKALGRAFEEQFEEHPEGVSSRQASCIAEKIAGASQEEAEELFFSGSSEPIIELAEGCA